MLKAIFLTKFCKIIKNLLLIKLILEDNLELTQNNMNIQIQKEIKINPNWKKVK